MRFRWWKTALTSQATLLIYFQMCMWLPLGAWNDQFSFPVQHGLQSSIGPAAIGLGTVLLVTATVLELHWLLWIGVVGHSLWFIAQATSIWPPYIMGASAGYAAMYYRVWGRTTKLLPSWGNHLAPDAMHVVIQVLLIAVLVSTVAELFTRKANKSGEKPQAIG